MSRSPAPWDVRAAAAERAVLTTYLRPLAHVPGTALGTARPAGRRRPGDRWNYWWQAQLLDVLVDAQRRAPAPWRRRVIARVARSVRWRNGGWSTTYHDDMAWLALALGRADRTTGLRSGPARARILGHLDRARDRDGLVGWRCGDGFRNVPANGPTAIALVRAGRPAGAARIAAWLASTVTDPGTGLVIDGVHADGRRAPEVYTYCQGVAVGTYVELAGVDPGGGWGGHAAALTRATAAHLTRSGVLVGRGGGDGGLFAGVCARYLALAAVRLGDTAARDVVLASAVGAWAGRDPRTGRVAADWSVAPAPGADDELSVQLSGWTVLEAAHVVASRGDRVTRRP